MKFVDHPQGLFSEPELTYHSQAVNHLSSHRLINIKEGKEDEDIVVKAHHRFGRWVHCCALEGLEEQVSKMVVGGLINPKTGNPYGLTTKKYEGWAKHIKETYGEEKEPVPYDVWEQVKIISQAVRANSHMAKALEEGVPESVGRTTLHGVRCQIRCDWLRVLPDGSDIHLYDLKTTRDITGFNMDAVMYKYPEQLAFYRQMLREITGFPVKEVFLVPVEKEGSRPRCHVIRLNSSQLDRIEESNNEWIKRIGQDSASPFVR